MKNTSLKKQLNSEQYQKKLQHLSNVILEANIETEIKPNPSSHQQEFSLRDLDGYYLTISEYHEY